MQQSWAVVCTALRPAFKKLVTETNTASTCHTGAQGERQGERGRVHGVPPKEVRTTIIKLFGRSSVVFLKHINIPIHDLKVWLIDPIYIWY